MTATSAPQTPKIPFALGAKSLQNLKQVHPDLLTLVRAAITLSDVDFGVTEPQVRTLAYQRTLVARGVSKTLRSNHIEQLDRTGRTKNLYGHAVDLVPYANGKFVWDWELIFHVAAAMARAATTAGLLNKLCWGGVWDRWMFDYDNPPTAAGMKAAEQAYCVRHKGSDFVDGPHFQLYVLG